MQVLGWLGLDGVLLFVMLREGLHVQGDRMSEGGAWWLVAIMLGAWWLLSYLLGLYEPLSRKPLYELGIGVGTVSALHVGVWYAIGALWGVPLAAVGSFLLLHGIVQGVVKLIGWLIGKGRMGGNGNGNSAAETEREWLSERDVTARTPNAQHLGTRVFDLIGALCMLVVFLPLMLMLLVLIPLTSQGAAIYAQQRVGRHGCPFPIYKFRTMVLDAERSTGPVLARSKDPRITPIGRVLRASRLDELPQLFNVLRGDMSLIGPRPERPEFVAVYERTIPGYQRRHLVRPGLSGHAQLKGDYSTETEEKLGYDLWYVYHRTWLLDLKILFRTVYVVLLPGKADGVKESHEAKSVRV
ncbi:MAG TPA: sugar transferase [Bacilli bacterium]|nr:sugar transferase [Bacilli bacterium]